MYEWFPLVGGLKERSSRPSLVWLNRPTVVDNKEAVIVKDRVDGLAWSRKQPETADVELLREIMWAMTEMLMEVEADSFCGAP